MPRELVQEEVESAAKSIDNATASPVREHIAHVCACVCVCCAREVSLPILKGFILRT